MIACVPVLDRHCVTKTLAVVCPADARRVSSLGLRPALYVHSQTNLHDVLLELEGSRTHFALVRDSEGGAVVGCVTLHDVIRRMTGLDLGDEYFARFAGPQPRGFFAVPHHTQHYGALPAPASVTGTATLPAAEGVRRWIARARRRRLLSALQAAGLVRRGSSTPSQLFPGLVPQLARVSPRRSFPGAVRLPTDA